MTRSTVKSLAKEIASEILKKNEEGLHEHTVRQAFQYYETTKTDVKPSTREDKRMLLAQLESRGFADKPLTEMNGAAMREFLQRLKLGESSTYVIYIRLCTVLSHYIRDNNLKIELQRGIIKLPTKPRDNKEPEYLNWDEVKKLLELQMEDKVEQLAVDFFCLMSLSGMAVSDAKLFNPASHFSEDGKWLKYTRKKTGNQCIIPLLPAVKRIASAHDWPLKMSTRWVQYQCTELITKLVGRKMKSHSGRKTFGTIMLEFNFSMESVSKMMGHSNPAITAKLYARITESKIQRELNNLPIAFQEMLKQ